MRPPLLWLMLITMTLLCAACEPTFEAQGALSLGGAPFQPTICHVLTCATGIELLDTNGTRVELTLPPATLKAFRDLKGTPRVKLEPGMGRPAVVFGPCGTMTLTGQGYHGSGKRAARGRLALNCKGAHPVEGQLSFSGCF